MAINLSPAVKREMARMFGAPVTPYWARTWPEVGENERAVVAQAVTGGEWGVPHSGIASALPIGHVDWTRAAALKLQHMLGIGHVVPTVNGSLALYALLAQQGIGAGDEVIVPSFTWQIATLGAVLMRGAVPVVVDSDEDTWCASPAAIRAAVTDRTRAFMPVALYGSAGPVDEYVQISHDTGLPFLWDLAHAFGARHHGKSLTSYCKGAATSWQKSKQPLTTGGGGAGMFEDAAAALQYENIVYTGHIPGAAPEQGFNFRLEQLQGALAFAQADRLAEQMGTRERIWPGVADVMTRYDWKVQPHQTGGPQYKLAAVRVAADGVATPVLREALTYLTNASFEEPYSVTWDPASKYLPELLQRTRYGSDSSYRKAIDATKTPMPVYAALAKDGGTWAGELLLNDEAPAVLEAAFQRIRRNWGQLRAYSQARS